MLSGMIHQTVRASDVMDRLDLPECVRSLVLGYFIGREPRSRRFIVVSWDEFEPKQPLSIHHVYITDSLLSAAHLFAKDVAANILPWCGDLRSEWLQSFQWSVAEDMLDEFLQQRTPSAILEAMHNGRAGPWDLVADGRLLQMAQRVGMVYAPPREGDFQWETHCSFCT